jgi:hypothetical protein
MYPKFLQPANIELFPVDGKTIEIPKCIVTFDKWTGQPVKETFGGKPIVSVDGKPMFAELAIRAHFIKDGWQARWIETYGKNNKEPFCLTEWKDDKYKNQIHTPIADKGILNLLAEIAIQNGGSYSGCWDVLGWKNERIIFAESKRTKKDSIRTTQTNWLAAGLRHGLNADNFLVVQWDLYI